MANIYLGENSWRAQHGETYCRGRGVNAATAGCILRLITQELRRGWTYDKRTGERIKMTPRLALKRARYLITLARRHYGAEEARRVAQLVKRFLRTLKVKTAF